MSKGGAVTITDKRTALGERYTELNELAEALPPQVRPGGINRPRFAGAIYFEGID